MRRNRAKILCKIEDLISKFSKYVLTLQDYQKNYIQVIVIPYLRNYCAKNSTVIKYTILNNS